MKILSSGIKKLTDSQKQLIKFPISPSAIRSTKRVGFDTCTYKYKSYSYKCFFFNAD